MRYKEFNLKQFPKVLEDVNGIKNYSLYLDLIEAEIIGKPLNESIDSKQIDVLERLKKLSSLNLNVGDVCDYMFVMLDLNGRLHVLGNNKQVTIKKIADNEYQFSDGKTFPDRRWSKLSYAQLYIFDNTANYEKLKTFLRLKFDTIVESTQHQYKQLVEYDRSKTVAALGTAILQRANKDAYLKSITATKDDNEIINTVLTAAEEADPTNNKQYVVWIVRQFTKNGMKYEDLYKLHDELAVFFKTKGQHKRLGVNSDINQYNWKTLADVTAKLGSTDLAEPDSEVSPVPDSKVLYNGPLGMLVIPETKEASCELGRGTKWCTAAQNRNMFDYYTKDGPLYIWIDKKDKAKYQFHFESFQFMDAQDTPIDAEKLDYFAHEHPVVKKLFASKKEAIGKGLGEYIGYLEDQAAYEYDPQGYEDEHGDPPTANDQFDELEPHTMFQLAGEENIKQHLKTIKKMPILAYSYALGIVRGAWPEGEKAILREPWYAVAYAKNVLKRRWPEAEPTIARTAATDNYYRAVQYAQHVIKGRWPEAEKFGIYNASFVLAYAEQILNSRWPDAEEKFNAQGYGYYKYAIKKYLEHFNITVDDLNTSDERKAALKQSLENV